MSIDCFLEWDPQRVEWRFSIPELKVAFPLGKEITPEKIRNLMADIYGDTGFHCALNEEG